MLGQAASAPRSHLVKLIRKNSDGFFLPFDSADSASLWPSLNPVLLWIPLSFNTHFTPLFPFFPFFLFLIFQTPVSASSSLRLFMGWKPRRTWGRAVPKSIPHSLPLSFLPLPPSLSHRSTVLPSSSSLLPGLAAAWITVLLYAPRWRVQTVFLFRLN